MTEVVLFHHAQGLTAGVAAFADRLRDTGHTVHTPDLFDGRTFDSIEAGLAYVKNDLGGMEAFGALASTAVSALPNEVVYAGFSLGVVAAQSLCQNRPGARGGVFCYSFIPPEFFGAWPDGLPAQVHGAADDPIFAGDGDLEAARAFADTGAPVEIFLYPGDQHYFADSSLPSYDAESTELLTARVLDFLG